MKFVYSLLFTLYANMSFCADYVADLSATESITNLEKFDSVKNSGIGVHVIKFYKPLCIDCQNLKKPWDGIVEKYQDRFLKFYDIDATVQELKDLAARLGVKNYPTIIIYRDGQELVRQVEPSPDQITEAIVTAFVS